MEILLQSLLTGVKDLELCIYNAKKSILDLYGNDQVADRLCFYDEALSKITTEVESLATLNTDNNFDEIDQSVKRIVQLSEMIKQDTFELLLSLETGMDLNVDSEHWN